MRRLWVLAIDLVCVGLSPYIALGLRQNFTISQTQLSAITVYCGVLVGVAALVFIISGLHTRVWRTASLDDHLWICFAVSVTLVIALIATFSINRLEGVARSLPIIQWFLLVTGLSGGRIITRVLRRKRDADLPVAFGTHIDEHILVVGSGHLAELFARSAATSGIRRHARIEGILTEDPSLVGGLYLSYPILGKPKRAQSVVEELRLHGIDINRIVVTELSQDLSYKSRRALEALTRRGDVEVDYLVERLIGSPGPRAQHPAQLRRGNEPPYACSLTPHDMTRLRKLAPRKRAFDVVASVLLICSFLRRSLHWSQPPY